MQSWCIGMQPLPKAQHPNQRLSCSRGCQKLRKTSTPPQSCLHKLRHISWFRCQTRDCKHIASRSSQPNCLNDRLLLPSYTAERPNSHASRSFLEYLAENVWDQFGNKENSLTQLIMLDEIIQFDPIVQIQIWPEAS